MPAENYYGDAAPAAAPEQAPPPETASPSEEKESNQPAGKTAVIDSSLCPGMKVGEEFMLRVEQITDGQYVVSYPEGESKEEGETEAPPAGAEAAGSEPAGPPAGGSAGGMGGMMY